MASSSSEVIDTTKSTFDFPIVNPYTVFDKPQASFKKSIKKLLGPSQTANERRTLHRGMTKRGGVRRLWKLVD